MSINFNVVAAFGRHVITAAASVISTVAIFHLITPEQANTLTNSVTQIGNGVNQIVAGVAPIIAIATAVYSSWTATTKSQLTSVAASVAKDPDTAKIIIEGDGTVQKVAAP